MGFTIRADPAFGCRCILWFGMCFKALLLFFSDIAGHFLHPGCTAVHCRPVHFKVSHDMSCNNMIFKTIKLTNICHQDGQRNKKWTV